MSDCSYRSPEAAPQTLAKVFRAALAFAKSVLFECSSSRNVDGSMMRVCILCTVWGLVILDLRLRPNNDPNTIAPALDSANLTSCYKELKHRPLHIHRWEVVATSEPSGVIVAHHSASKTLRREARANCAHHTHDLLRCNGRYRSSCPSRSNSFRSCVKCFIPLYN